MGVVHDVLQEDCIDGNDQAYNGRCENLSSLTVHLQRLLENRNKFVLVFDGVDKQREAPPTLLPALARLGEVIPQLTVVLIERHAAPRFLHQPGVPHIHFAPYSRAQSIHIVARKPQDIFPEAPPYGDPGGLRTAVAQAQRSRRASALFAAL